MAFTRRTLLLGAAATAVLAAAYPALRQVGSYPDPPVPFRNLTPKTAAIWAILGDFIVPPGGPLPGSGGDVLSLQRLDAMLSTMTPDMRWKLQALPLAFEHGTLLDRYGARSLVHLPPERQRAWLTWWAEAQDPLRAQLFMAARSVFTMTYFERADVVQAMGVEPGCG